jgi:hypothetical protein
LFLTRFRTNKIASPPQTKMTSKTTFRVLSFKFLRPCLGVSRPGGQEPGHGVHNGGEGGSYGCDGSQRHGGGGDHRYEDDPSR